MSNASRLAALFNESGYLNLNEDVAEAVRQRAVTSGWHYFVAKGYREYRAGAPPGLPKMVTRVMEHGPREPVPSAALRKRVHGSDDASTFESIGARVSFEMLRELATAGISLPRNGRILDFGCGCGRILRYFHHLLDTQEVYGTDIDEEAVVWCRENLPRMGMFSVNDRWPPLDYPDDMFDLVYSISIFTHLPEDMELAWLAELGRVTKPGGYLLLTVVGPELFHSVQQKRSAWSLRTLSKQVRILLNPESFLNRHTRFGDARAREHLQKEGFYYLLGSDVEGLPKFYQGSFHTEEYVRRRWREFFDVLGISVKGIGDCQDLVLCRKRGAPSA